MSGVHKNGDIFLDVTMQKHYNPLLQADRTNFVMNSLLRNLNNLNSILKQSPSYKSSNILKYSKKYNAYTSSRSLI